MKKIRMDIIFILFAVVCFGAYGVITYNNWKLSDNANEVRNKLLYIDSSIFDENMTNKLTKEKKQEIPYAKLYEKNQDMIGWLEVPGTNIDYPVMQTPENEEYYLYRDFFGNEDKNGTLFMDADSHLTDETPNLIIHGHHMKSGAMFGNLSDYLDEEYYKERTKIHFYTKKDIRIYELISIFQTKVYSRKETEEFQYYNYFELSNEQLFNEYYKNIKKNSLYDTNVIAEYGDEFITLSTCSYHTKNGRLVLVAKLIDKIELE